MKTCQKKGDTSKPPYGYGKWERGLHLRKAKEGWRGGEQESSVPQTLTHYCSSARNVEAWRTHPHTHSSVQTTQKLLRPHLPQTERVRNTSLAFTRSVMLSSHAARKSLVSIIPSSLSSRGMWGNLVCCNVDFNLIRQSETSVSLCV